MKITAFISRVTAQYKASEALVLPVEAQAARLAPIMWACVNAADMPLSLKLPEGFIPSYCSNSRPGSRPTYLATPAEGCSSVWPSPIGDHLLGGANGNSSWNRHTPLEAQADRAGATIWPRNASNESGGRARSQS